MKYLVGIYSFLIINSAYSQSTVEEIIFESDIYKSERKISVYLPKDYYESDTSKTYVCAYVYDGQFQPYLGMVASMIDYYAQTDEGIPMIVVGIHTSNRWEEFVPVPESENEPAPIASGKLDTFMNQEVFPLIEATYRTSTYKLGVGHSLGGTYVMQALAQESPLFDAVIAVSPNLTMYNEMLVEKIAGFLSTTNAKQKYIFTTVGSDGEMENDFKSSLESLNTTISKINSPVFHWTFDVQNKENHMTTFIPGFNKGYLDLCSHLFLKDNELVKLAIESTDSIAATINDFYAEVENFSGIKVNLTPEDYLKFARTLNSYQEYYAANTLYKYISELLTEKTDKDSKELVKNIDNAIEYSSFNMLIKEAKQYKEKGDFEMSSQKFEVAFAMNVIRGTHLARIHAVPVFAQTGRINEAFEQLDLLANKFVLGGNGSFLNDPLCTPLHSDKRWNMYMEKLAKNAQKYE